MIAGVGAGLFNFSAVRNFVVDVEEIEPIGEQQEDYLRLYELFKESYLALEKTFEGLNGVRRG